MQPNVKELQIAVSGFLGEDAAPFCRELWLLCIDAQSSPHGVPKVLIEAKMASINPKGVM